MARRVPTSVEGLYCWSVTGVCPDDHVPLRMLLRGSTPTALVRNPGDPFGPPCVDWSNDRRTCLVAGKFQLRPRPTGLETRVAQVRGNYNQLVPFECSRYKNRNWACGRQGWSFKIELRSTEEPVISRTLFCRREGDRLDCRKTTDAIKDWAGVPGGEETFPGLQEIATGDADQICVSYRDGVKCFSGIDKGRLVDASLYGQSNAPSGLRNARSLAVGPTYSLAVTDDGVHIWGVWREEIWAHE